MEFVQPICHKVVDKYVEYELILVIIDVILHRPQAFRHVLYNRRSLTHGIKVIGCFDINTCVEACICMHKLNTVIPCVHAPNSGGAWR